MRPCHAHPPPSVEKGCKHSGKRACMHPRGLSERESGSPLGEALLSQPRVFQDRPDKRKVQRFLY